jgi:hypothetical protein
MRTLAAIKFKYFYQLGLPAMFIFFTWLNPGGGIAGAEYLAGRSFWFCPFFYWTGLSCPGCGLTRSLIAFFSFDMGSSFYFHPGGPLIGLFAVFFWMYSFFVDDFSLNSAWGQLPKTLRLRMTMSSLVALVGWGILRNLLDLH